MIQLSLQLFGHPSVAISGRKVHIPRRKATALLIYLAATRRSYSRAQLAKLLWPDFDANSARAEVRRALSALNRAIGADWFVTDEDTIALVAGDGVWVDLWEFQAQMAECRRKEPPDLLYRLNRVVDIAQPGFLTGFEVRNAPAFEHWQTLKSVSLQQDLAWALELLAHHLAELADVYGALRYAQQRLLLDPLHEDAQRRVMQLHVTSGDNAAALRQYEEYVLLLQQELDTKPSRELAALADTIRSGATPLPQMAQAPLVRRTQREIQHNLPQPVTPLVGRHSELADLAKLLKDSNQRMVTLAGLGGIGKTRLALAAAHQCLTTPTAAWAHGVWLVTLANVSSTEEAATAIAHVLPLALRGASPVLQQVLDYLRSRRMLLVLDNFETVLALADADVTLAFLDDLIQHAPDVRLLITSREPLNLHGETVINVRGLPFPSSSTEDAEIFDAVRLFVQSAQRSRHSFALSDANRDAIVHICQLLEGMPLALDLAAPLVRLLTVTEIIQEITNGLDALETNAPNLPPRHRSIRTVLEHSWRFLDTDERIVFARLAVFHNGFSRQAAEYVTGASIRTLGALVDKSFLSRDELGRFSIHTLTQQFGWERLHDEGNGVAQVLTDHMIYYAKWLSERRGRLRNQEQVVAWSEIEREHDNVHAAWRYALQSGNETGLTYMHSALFRFYADRGRFLAGRNLFGESLMALSHETSDGVRLYLRVYHASFQVRTGQLDTAAQTLNQVLPVLQNLAMDECFVLALRTLGVLEDMQGNYLAAFHHLEEALTVAQTLEDKSERSAILNSMGVVAWGMGDYINAEAHLRQALALARSYGAPYDIALRLGNLGNLPFSEDNKPEALTLFQEAYTRFEEIDNLWGMGVTLQNLANCYAELGETQQVIAMHEQALRFKDEVGDTRGVVHSLLSMAENYLSMDNMTLAGEYLARALDLAHTTHQEGVLSSIIGIYGKYFMRRGEIHRATQLLSFACAQPTLVDYMREQLLADLTALAEQVPADEFALKQAEGKTADMETIVLSLHNYSSV